MPTYEYHCKSCENRFELFQKISDPAPASCPKCGSGPIQKIFSSVGIIFKGSGFYVTDYKQKEARAASGEGAKESGSKESTSKESPTKESSSSDSKPSGESGSPAKSGSDATKSAA